VYHIELLPNLFTGLALDHVGDHLAPYINQRLDVEIIGGYDDLEEHLLVNRDEPLVPFANIRRSLSAVVRAALISSLQRLAAVVFAVLQNLFQNKSSNVGQRDRLVAFSEISEQAAACGDIPVNMELLVIRSD